MSTFSTGALAVMEPHFNKSAKNGKGAWLKGGQVTLFSRVDDTEYWEVFSEQYGVVKVVEMYLEEFVVGKKRHRAKTQRLVMMHAPGSTREYVYKDTEHQSFDETLTETEVAKSVKNKSRIDTAQAKKRKIVHTPKNEAKNSVLESKEVSKMPGALQTSSLAKEKISKSSQGSKARKIIKRSVKPKRSAVMPKKKPRVGEFSTKNVKAGAVENPKKPRQIQSLEKLQRFAEILFDFLICRERAPVKFRSGRKRAQDISRGPLLPCIELVKKGLDDNSLLVESSASDIAESRLYQAINLVHLYCTKNPKVKHASKAKSICAEISKEILAAGSRETSVSLKAKLDALDLKGKKKRTSIAPVKKGSQKEFLLKEWERSSQKEF